MPCTASPTGSPPARRCHPTDSWRSADEHHRRRAGGRTSRCEIAPRGAGGPQRPAPRALRRPAQQHRGVDRAAADIGALRGTQIQYTWVVTATLLTATATTPIWGKLADLFNKKVLIQIAIVVFVVGSMICGLSQNAGELIAARAFQGVGVGGLQALVQVAIAAMIPPRERGRYNGYLGGVMALATVGGPLLGGLIVDTSWLGWRWCFYIGVPFAVVALVLLQKTLHLPAHPPRERQDRLPGRRADRGRRQHAAHLGLVRRQLVRLALLADDGWSAARWRCWPWRCGSRPGPRSRWSRCRSSESAPRAGDRREPRGRHGDVRRRGLPRPVLPDRPRLQPTEAGLLTIPLMAGVLVSSIVVGRLISRTGRIKPFLVAGIVILVAASSCCRDSLDHDAAAVRRRRHVPVGAGVGMTMQNLVLAVQNTVALKDIGAASRRVAFFRSLGRHDRRSVLGAVLAHRVGDVHRGRRWPAAPASGSSGGRQPRPRRRCRRRSSRSSAPPTATPPATSS